MEPIEYITINFDEKVPDGYNGWIRKRQFYSFFWHVCTIDGKLVQHNTTGPAFIDIDGKIANAYFLYVKQLPYEEWLSLTEQKGCVLYGE